MRLRETRWRGSAVNLHPGDLCVITDNGHVHPDHRCYVGRTVVLIAIAPIRDYFAPFWRCSGIAPTVVVSHAILKRIPPEKMIDARSHLKPVTEEEPECHASTS
jgi:hypothetical protein